MIRFATVCSGIGAPELAAEPLGWQCVFGADIEPFPNAVRKHHWPQVPNLGDIKKVTKEQIESFGHIDVFVAGFPCQDLSLAGQRKGIYIQNYTSRNCLKSP